MSVELNWVWSLRASALHAARAARDVRIVTPGLAAALRDPAEALDDLLVRAAPDAGAAWERLLARSHQQVEPAELAASVLGDGTRAAELERSVRALVDACERCVPDMRDQWADRGRPLRELWQARGPGMFHAARRRFYRWPLIQQADVVLVHPAGGGGAAAQPATRSVRVEAVLTNNVPGLPETVRLLWCLLQLEAETEPATRPSPIDARLDAVRRLVPLAVLPAALELAAGVDLVDDTRDTLEAALRAWCMAPHAAELAKTLAAWWASQPTDLPPKSSALDALAAALTAAEAERPNRNGVDA